MELHKGLTYGFLDDETHALDEYKPRLILNDAERGEKVLTSILQELKHCDEFWFSVAFITQSGVTVLLHALQELEERGIKGKILASQYQNFSEPRALERLRAFSNVELRIVPEDQGKMHTKGYIFRRKEEYAVIVGSSNMTQSALCENKEWNLKVISSGQGALLKQTLLEFQGLFQRALPVDDAWLEQYSALYDKERKIRLRIRRHGEENPQSSLIAINRILPNRMQLSALEALEKTRIEKNTRALVISATGTGKTYLSAFDVKKFGPKRFLFVVHREQIAKAAMSSFQRVFGLDRTMAVLSGHHREISADFIFSTIQTLSKEDILTRFRPDTFDYIVIDEVHRAGAYSYQRILEYFRPRFLLGMSATPERTDGYDLFELFEHNVAYEIRLRDAMRENMICPFHYFGITELLVDGAVIDDATAFSLLTSDERVKNILDKILFYGYSGDRVKGLVFCSRKAEAEVLAAKFNEKGYRSVALSGESPQFLREESVERLGQDSTEGALDFIFTVDIFNEGVDIPEINLVVMLRPTQSAIIFVQQLGRGLRHSRLKEYVVVLDFIGNYQNNFLIPIALSGDQTYNKDNIRRFVAEGNRTLPGCSTVNFDTVTKQRIYGAIDRADFNDMKLIKEAYQNLKNRLGRIPSLSEFEELGSMDLSRIIAKSRSYVHFLMKHEPQSNLVFSEMELTDIAFVSEKYLHGKRPQELLILSLILQGDSDLFSTLETQLNAEYGIPLRDTTVKNLINQMTQNFITGTGKNTYKTAVFLEKGQEGWKIAKGFQERLQNRVFRETMEEMVQVGLRINSKRYRNLYPGTNFVLYEKYSYEDVCRGLDWETNQVPLNIGGYRYDRDTKTYPVFINYHKDESISDTTKYHDRFLSPSELIAISKAQRYANSEDVRQVYAAKDEGVEMSLFVRKNKDDKISKEFYFLGRIQAYGVPHEFLMPNTQASAVEIHYRLETPIREDLYDFLTQTDV